MVTLEKTAVPLHTMADDELEAVLTSWDMEWWQAFRTNDLDGIEQAETFQRIYFKEWTRRNW